MAHAAEALVGKAVGEKRRDALMHAVNLTLKWSVIFAAGFTLLYVLGGPLIIAILTDLPDIRETATSLSAMDDRFTAGIGLVLSLRRCLRRRHASQGNAQYHGVLNAVCFSTRLVSAAASW